jgi:hypothetical protein
VFLPSSAVARSMLFRSAHLNQQEHEMKLRNAVALGFAVFTMSGTALASDASADRAAAMHRSLRAATVAENEPHHKMTERSQTDARDCNRKDCCAMNGPSPALAPTSTPQFTDVG